MRLRVEDVTEATEPHWRQIHNLVVPASPLSEHDVRQRRTINRLTLAFDGDELVGNATLRPPTTQRSVATVIVRILPHLRRRGYGAEYADWLVAAAGRLEPDHLETVVLVANRDGLRFALSRGFVESKRYTVDGADYVDLRWAPDPPDLGH